MQMSFWGATVITSLATSLPVIGKTVVTWLWGGFSVDNPTLNRFYSLHYTLPFVLAGLSVFHIAALHQYGSTNPLGVNSQSATLNFLPYYGTKDLITVMAMLFVFSCLVFFYPDLLGHPMAPLSEAEFVNSAMCWNHLCLYSTRTISEYFDLVFPLSNLGMPISLLSFFSLGKGIKSVPCSVKILYSNCSVCVTNGLRKQTVTHLQSNQGQSAGNQFGHILLEKNMPLVGSSETIRTTSLNIRFISGFFYVLSSLNKAFSTDCPKNADGLQKQTVNNVYSASFFSKVNDGIAVYNSNSNNFNSWLAGLIDGDGTLRVGNGGAHFELTLDAKDVQTLHKIKGILGFGNISKRSGVNAYRIRTSKYEYVLDVLNRVNGLLLTSGKHAQLQKICAFYGITPIIPSSVESINIIKTTAWLSGFFDAEGHFNVMNKFTLAFHVAQKDPIILNLIKEALCLGHIRFDKSWNGWHYTISDLHGIICILKLFHKYPLLTVKNVDLRTFKRLVYFKHMKYHYINSPHRYKVEHLVSLFKARNKTK